MKPFTIRKAT
jgi:hypothetical protein